LFQKEDTNNFLRLGYSGDSLVFFFKQNVIACKRKKNHYNSLRIAIQGKVKFLLGGKPRERLGLRIRCNSEGDSKGWIEEELDLNFLHLEITLGRFCFGVIFISRGERTQKNEKK